MMFTIKRLVPWVQRRERVVATRNIVSSELSMLVMLSNFGWRPGCADAEEL